MSLAVCVGSKHGVSFYNPQLEGWSTHYIPLEAAVKDCCRLLLYVISEDTRAMTSMIEVHSDFLLVFCSDIWLSCLLSFDTVGWASGRESGL